MENNTTILTIGDRPDFDSYRKAILEKKSFLKEGFHYKTASFAHFLDGKAPRIKTDRMIIFLFFPFRHWNQHIEHPTYQGVYGNQTFYNKFLKFWKSVERQIKHKYSDKEILFINDPKLSSRCRDKRRVSEILAKAGISQPRTYHRLGLREIQNKLDNGHKFFLKVRFGSMGKGITFLSRENWQTNFSFKNGKIESRKSDHGWEFSNVTGDYDFLKKLLKKDIIIQEGIDPLIIDGHMVDLRIYTFFNEVTYVYPRKNKPDKVTTNISQGGKGDKRLLKTIPKYLIEKAKKEAVKVSTALGLNLAGIDIIPDKNFKEVYVIDANAFAGFPKRRTFNLARHMATDLGQRLRRKELFTSPSKKALKN